MCFSEKLKKKLSKWCGNYSYDFYYFESSICCLLKFDCYFRKSFPKESGIWLNSPADPCPSFSTKSTVIAPRRLRIALSVYMPRSLFSLLVLQATSSKLEKILSSVDEPSMSHRLQLDKNTFSVKTLDMQHRLQGNKIEGKTTHRE